MKRSTKYPILPLILNRWSPRAMSGESISKHELFTLFDAARWAPSSFNNQPWRFIYGEKGSTAFDRLFNLLVSANQEWCKNAAALILVVSRKTFSYNGKPSRTHSFDTGASLENLALQGFSMGLVIHGMEGFDYDKARSECNVPDGFDIEAMFAVGKATKKPVLSPELQKREVPSERKPLETLIAEGHFSFKD